MYGTLCWGLRWQKPTRAQSSPLGTPYAGQRQAVSLWLVISITKGQLGGMQAQSRLLSGDGIPASRGQTSCLLLGSPRTLSFPAGLRSVDSPARDSGYTGWAQGLSPTSSEWKQQHRISEQSSGYESASRTNTACLPAWHPSSVLVWPCPHGFQKSPQHEPSRGLALLSALPCPALYCALRWPH